MSLFINLTPLWKYLGLQDEPYEVLYTKAQQMFDQDQVSEVTKKKLRDAYSRLHIQAIRRLILAGDIQPVHLSGLSCHIDIDDLYMVFPSKVVIKIHNEEADKRYDFHYLNDYFRDFAIMLMQMNRPGRMNWKKSIIGHIIVLIR